MPQDNPNNEEGIQTDSEFIQAGRATIVNDDGTDPNADTGSQDQPDAGSESNDDGEKKYAGVYDSVDKLEKGYKDLQAEYTRLRQASKNGGSTDGESGSDGGQQPDANATDLDELRMSVAEMKIDREWGKLERKYGADIREKVRAHFDTLPEEDQRELNTMAGAKMIAQMITDKGKSPSGKQSTGSPQSHRGAGKSKLTRAIIQAMPEHEYQARQAEIRQFYEENHGS